MEVKTEKQNKEVIKIKSKVSISWENVKIQDVLFFQEGPGVRNIQFTNSGVKLLNVGNINFGNLNLDATKIYISEKEAFGKYKHFLVEEGDLLIASSGIVVDNFHNKITWAKKEHLPLCLNTSTIRFRTLNSNILDIRYFSYFLKTRLFADQLSKLITGSAQLNFGPSHLKQISFPLPPLETQKRIAEILDAADALRRKDQELLKKYDELAQAIFIDMFGDPVKNEKGWEVKKLENQFNSIRYGTGSPPQYSEIGIPFLRATNVKAGRIERKGMVFLSEQEAQKISKCFVNEGDLIIVRSGANTGDCAYITNEYANCLAGYDLIVEMDKVKSRFYNYFLNSIWGKGIIEKLSRRAGQPHLNSMQVSNIECIAPEYSYLEKFKVKIDSIENLRNISIKTNNISNDLFHTLIQKAFKGELVA
jgi:type I restriction enzyme S subunit